jgi:hypothetical protein
MARRDNDQGARAGHGDARSGSGILLFTVAQARTQVPRFTHRIRRHGLWNGTKTPPLSRRGWPVAPDDGGMKRWIRAARAACAITGDQATRDALNRPGVALARRDVCPDAAQLGRAVADSPRPPSTARRETLAAASGRIVRARCLAR